MIKEIPCITCPQKPQGSMAIMVMDLTKFAVLLCLKLNIHKRSHAKFNISILQVKLNLSGLEDISDDIDFCFRLAKEESVIILPGKKQMKLNNIHDPKQFIT